MDDFDAGIELGEGGIDLNKPGEAGSVGVAGMEDLSGDQGASDGGTGYEGLEIEEPSNFDDDMRDRNKKAQEVASKLGKDGVGKVQFFVCAILIVIVVLFLVAGGITKAKRIQAEEKAKLQPSDKVDTTHLEKDFPRLLNDSLVVSEDMYQDRVEIKKYILLENGSCNFYFSGRPIYFGSDIAWQVSSEVYNKIPNGTSAKIQFCVVSIKDSTGNTNDFMTDIQIVQPEV